MTNEIRAHIRSLLWQYKKIEKSLENMAEVITTEPVLFLEQPLPKEHRIWTMNQIVFYKQFLRVVKNVLEDLPSDTKDIFYVKYVNGYQGKGNDLVALETFLSESTIKRRDCEFLKEIAIRLGWFTV